MTPPLEGAHERLLWTIMRRFESLGLDAYRAHVPELPTDGKEAVLAALGRLAPDDAPLERSALAAPLRALERDGAPESPPRALFAQGLVLEHLGEAIYAALLERTDLAPASLDAARLALTATREVLARVPDAIRSRLGEGEAIFPAFCRETRPVLEHLDALGEEIDEAFAERFSLRFAALMGELVAGLLPVCIALGMARRKVVCHLTAALMSAA